MVSFDYDSKQKGLFDFTSKLSDGKVVRNVVKNEAKKNGSVSKKQKAQSSLFDFEWIFVSMALCITHFPQVNLKSESFS